MVNRTRRGRIMKTALVVILFAAFALAQQSSNSPQFHAACGPLGVSFDTQTSTARPPAQPDPGKALVYVAEDFPTVQATIGSP